MTTPITTKATIASKNGLGPLTQVATFTKVGITQAEMKAAISAAEAEGNSVAGTIVASGVLTLALQGAGVTAGADYGATGVTAAVVVTFQ